MIYNNISNSSSLLILKMDIYEKRFLIPIIEYEVFDKETKKKLDLNICKDLQIEISIPANIDEKNLFKYNPNSDDYNDICFPYTTKNKTDITIKDKRNEYKNNNLSLCESNCNYIDYNSTTKNVLCKCNIKMKFPLISEIEINKDKLLNNFKDVKNTNNINVVKCYYTLFKKEGIIKNIGNYFICIIIIISIILSIYFAAKGYNTFKNRIEKILNQNKKEKIKNNPPKIKFKKKYKLNEMKTIGEIIDKSNSILNKPTNIIKNKNKNIPRHKTKHNTFIGRKKNKLNTKTIYNNNTIETYNDYELNNLI